MLAVLGVGFGARNAGAVEIGPRVVRTFQLANGLRVALAPDTGAATVDVALWFPSGTRYERSGQSGLTHLFDGLLFAGTTRRPSGEHYHLIQREGGSVTAFSAPDFACVDDNVPPEALELALGLEADRMAHLALTAKSLAAAIAALRREHQSSDEQSPLGQSLRRLYATAFAGHPYRLPAQGVESDLSRLTLPVVQAWWRDHYGPSGTCLTVCGQFQPDSAEAMVRRAFGPIPARGAARVEPAPPARQILERRASATVVAQVPVLVIGWRTASEGDPDARALEVLDRLLSHGEGSWLERALVTDSSACLALESGLDLRRDGGMYYLVTAIRPGVDSTEAEREVLDRFDRLIQNPVAAADVGGAIKQTELDALLGWQTSQGWGRSLGTSRSVEGDFAGGSRRLDQVRALMPQQIRDAAEHTFTEGHRTVVWASPVAQAAKAAAPAPRPRSTPAAPKKGVR